MSPPPAAPGWTPPQRLAIALVFLLAVAAYAALAMAGFVFDDVPLVVDNTLTGDLGNLPRFFTTDLWQTAGSAQVDSGYYRPLMLLSLAVDRALWGLSPAGHHLHSLAWHLAATAALLGLLLRLAPRTPAILGAALFALHPIQSEAVAWIAARNDLMAAAFTFLAAGLLLEERPRLVALLGGGLAALCALLSKESGIFVVGLVGLLDLARWGRPRGPARYGVMLAAVGAWAALRAAADIQPASVPGADGLALLAGAAPQLGAHYLRRVLWPWPLSVGATIEYLRDPWPQVAAGWLGGALLAGALLGRGRRLGAAGLVFAALAFGPPLLAIGVRGQLGERYLYLPMGGLAIALAAAAPRSDRALLAALPVVAAWMGALHHRLPEWRDDLALQAAAVEDTPSGYSRTSLAHIYNQQERYAEATPLFQEALRDHPPYLDACAHAVRSPLYAGLLEDAVAGVRLTDAAGCPADGRLLGLQALALAQAGQWDEARARVERSGGDPDERLMLVGAALAWIDQDRARFEGMRDSVDAAPEVFEAQVARLLAAGGIAPE